MGRQELMIALTDLPKRIEEQELRVMERAQAEREAKEALADEEGSVLLNDMLDGKNEPIRAAQLRDYTRIQRQAAEKARRAVECATVHLHRLQAESSCLRAVARLLEGARD